MEYSVLLRPDYFEEHEKALRKQVQKSAKAKVPADVKLALYRQENYRRRLLREKGREINIRPKDKTKVSTATQAEVNPIIETLPKSLQTKGEAFLNFLQSIPELRINEKGEISYGGSRVIGSRIADLVHDFVRDRPKKSPAVGFELLARALRDHNVPREFIGNRAHWQHMQSLDTSTPLTPRRDLSSTLSDLDSLRRRLQFQSGSGIEKALKALKWKTR